MRTHGFSKKYSEFLVVPLCSVEEEICQISKFKLFLSHHIPPRRKPHRLSSGCLLLPVISLLWLVPIATLLALNYANHVIGASAWCPLGRCSADPLMNNAVQRAKQLDKADHNTLGALLLVAKSLEVWFMLIATSVVYDISMVFAMKGNGLPVGYFLTHLQFGNFRSLFNPLLWSSSVPSSNIHQPKRTRKFKLCVFAVLVVFLTVLTNLMGPATAVLVLPTLQWVDTRHMLEEKFEEVGAARPPGLSGPLDILGCDTDDFLAHNYSCTSSIYRPALASWATSALVVTVQPSFASDPFQIVMSQEGSLNFLLNTSLSTDIIWVPSRQALMSLSNQFDQIFDVNQELESTSKGIKGFNNSLQTILNRQGPTIGLQTTCFAGNLTTVEIAEDKHALCYSGWKFGFDGFTSNESVSTYQKCIPWGQKWDILNRRSRFSIGPQPFDNLTGFQPVAVAISNYFVEKAIYWNDTEDFGSGLLDCRRHDPSLKSCDWEKIFTTPMTEPFRNTSMNVGLMEYDFSLKLTSDSRTWCDTFAYLGFATYSLDTSPSSNPTSLVMMREITDLKPDSTPLVINPNWLLAAWSVDHDEVINGKLFPASMIPTAVIDSNGEQSASWDDISTNKIIFILFHYYSMCQTMSIINYNWTDPSDLIAGSEDDSHPVFRSWSTRHVWVYGFSSRTAKLGAVVVFAGAFCVLLLRIPLSIFGGAHRYNAVELLVAALEYIPRGDFLNHQSTKSMAKVCFQLRDDGDGKVAFVSERSVS